MNNIQTLVGHVDVVKKVPSRQIVQIIIEVPAEHFKKSVSFFDDEDVFVNVVSKQAMKELPYGVHELGGDEPAPVKQEPDVKSTGRVGKWCLEAIEFCKNADFQNFMMRVKGTLKADEFHAKDELCIRCGVDSRKELDTNEVAHKSAQDIYREYFVWLKEEKR